MRRKKLIVLSVIILGFLGLLCGYLFLVYFPNQMIWIDRSSGIKDNRAHFQEMLVNFDKIENISDYKIFFEDQYGIVPILVYSLKMNRQDIWNKCMSYIYDYLALRKTPPPLEKTQFLRAGSGLFLDIRSGIKVINQDDFSIDLKIFFNELPIGEALKNCEVGKKFSPKYNDISACQDNIYFYRATKRNGYCEKINREYYKHLCAGLVDLRGAK